MNWLSRDLVAAPLGLQVDPFRPAKRAVITHAHADHARPGHEAVLATPDTIALMKLRYGEGCAKHFQVLEYGKPLRVGEGQVTLFPAGHILGSAQVLLEYQGQRALITGDYKTRPDRTAQAYERVPCDLLVTEATFALPVFVHPDPLQEAEKLLRSLRQSKGRTHLVGAYALGKGQRVVSLLRELGYEGEIFLHGSHLKLSAYYLSQGIDLGRLSAVPHLRERDKGSWGGVVVMAPPSALKDRWSRRFDDPVIGYASGWMMVKQRAKQSLVELPMVISDHVDWEELTTCIVESGAEQVWVTHGREEAIVHWCQSRGIAAEPLSMQGREEEGS